MVSETLKPFESLLELLLLKTRLRLRDFFSKALLKLMLFVKLVFELLPLDSEVLLFKSCPFSSSEEVEEAELLLECDSFSFGATTSRVVGLILYSNSKLALFPVFSFLVLESD
jgi:hypothetical protein